MRARFATDKTVTEPTRFDLGCFTCTRMLACEVKRKSNHISACERITSGDGDPRTLTSARLGALAEEMKRDK